MERLLLVAVRGGIGSALRHAVSVVVARGLGSDFPFGTLRVNLAGSFFIGLVQELGAEALLLPDSTRLFVTTGMLGGFTAYSTFSYETLRLLQAGAWPQAWIPVRLAEDQPQEDLLALDAAHAPHTPEASIRSGRSLTLTQPPRW